jgi:hypothetical protein
MSTHRSAGIRSAAALLLLALTSTGCSYFTATKKLDMQPFAENTVTSIGELRRLDRPPSFVRLRAYFSHPAIEDVRREYQPMRQLLQAVNAYSVQLVSLNDARTSDARKIRELVRYVREVSPIALQQAGAEEDDELLLTTARLEEVLKGMSRQETFLGALAASEPLVAAVQTKGLGLSDRVSAAIAKASFALEGLVQKDFADMVSNRAALVALQERVTRAQTLAERVSLGDQAALDELRRDLPVAQELLKGDRRPTSKELQPVLEALVAQLHRIQVALEQIKPEYDAYRESLAELDAMRNQVTERSRLERSMLMVWARSHRNLGRGVEVPAAFDLAKILAAGANKAVGIVVPGL